MTCFCSVFSSLTMILLPTQAPSYPNPYIIIPGLHLTSTRKQSTSSLRCCASNHNPQQQKAPPRSSTEVHLVTKLRTTLKTRKFLQPNQKVLVAVSGGQDSISLIYLLKQLQQEWKWELGVVHCDHQWSPGSRPQASHVAHVASYLGLDFYQAVATGNVSGETAARTWRYNILHRIASSHGYSTIVTAHTASDRVETLLHNLFRGTGLHGMLSLTWKRWLAPETNSSGRKTVAEIDATGERELPASSIALVRPLLDVSRVELRNFSDMERLPIWPDQSNFSMDIRRNRIRHKLLPFLRKNFDPSVDKSLLRWAEILHGEDDFLDNLCMSIRKQAESLHDNGRIKLDVRDIRTMHVAIQRRIIKEFVEGFSGKSLGFDHVENVRLTCLSTKCRDGFCISLPGNVVLQFSDNAFLLSEKQRN